VTAAATHRRDAHLRRLQTFEFGLNTLPRDRLRRSPDETTATIWAIGSTEVYTLMTTIRGYSGDQVRTWLADTLVDAVLRP
jgi:hypothetical protein